MRTTSVFDLSGQVALVTGASGGLGRAIAVVMAQQGADLVLADRKTEACEEIARVCREHGARVQVAEADLSRPDDVEMLAKSAPAAFGRIDVLVCNAGMQGPAGALHDVNRSDWDMVFQVNLASCHVLCSRLIPGMAARGGGSVVLMSSIAGLRGNKSIGLYGLTKAALAGMARNLAVEWGPSGVRVNAIAPGSIRTPLAAGLIAAPGAPPRNDAAAPRWGTVRGR